MHACGHDIHCAMLLGAMKAIAQRHVVPSVNLRFVFQRAEENPGTAPNPISGGKRLVEEGILEGVHDVHGLHIWTHPGTESGTFYCVPGQAMANSDRIKMVITCSGGHVMNPEHGSNAIDIATDVCNGLKGFALRTLGPDEAVSLVPAIFTSGTGSNIRPASAELWFGNRNFLKPEMRASFAERIADHVRRIVIQYPDASVEVQPIEGHPMLFNDPDDVARVEVTLKAQGLSTQQYRRLFGGEDFAYYLQQRPGSFWFLSGLRDGCGDHHTPTFNPDESAFHLGTAFWLALATEPVAA
jgi:amidohydrolase